MAPEGIIGFAEAGVSCGSCGLCGNFMPRAGFHRSNNKVLDLSRSINIKLEISGALFNLGASKSCCKFNVNSFLLKCFSISIFSFVKESEKNCINV